MTGWAKVVAITVLLVIALVGLNLSMWRRMRLAIREGRRREGERSGER